MRIAIVTAWYPSHKNPLYGIFVQNQAKALSEHCSVTVLLLNWSLIPYVRYRNEGKVRVIEKGDFYFPNASELLLNFWASQYVRFFKTIHESEKFDLIHCHDHYGAFVCEKIKKQVSIPFICTIHNSNIMNDKLVGWKKAYLPRILNKADKVVSVGRKLANVLEEKYRINDVSVIPNYIDTNTFSIQENHEVNDFRFIFIGGLEQHKGILELIEAFHVAKLPETSLHIIGSGILENDVRSLIEEYQLEETVHLYGDVPNDELPYHYNASDVCVSVSEYETFGIAILEAMACGLPILYTSSGGPDEIVNELSGVQIKDRSINSIAEGLRQIKNDIDQFDKMKIRSYVVANFGEERSIGALLNEYKLILNAKN